MKFFKDVKTLEELKQEYKRLAKLHHPDVGGDHETMKLVNSEYDEMVKILKNGNTDKNQDSDVDLEDFKEVIEKLIIYDDIILEIVGTWLWASGDTKPHKELLSKELGFFWNPKREVWQKKPKDQQNKKFVNSKKSDEELKRMYGSKKVKSGGKKLIAS